MKPLVRRILPLLFLVTATSQAAEPVSIGYVDMQTILDKSKMGQQAQAALKEEFSGRQQKFVEEEKSIRQLQETLKKDQALMSQAELDKRKAEIQGRAKKLQQEAGQAQQELVREQNKLGSAILGPTQAIIAAVAKEKRVSAIFERRQSGLLYIDEGLDLTPEVIKRLDAQKKKKKK
jgi:outer membrane protein